MAIQLSVEAALGPAITWTDQVLVQLPFATSVALNRTAYQVQQALGYETTRYFDRPTTFTQRGFRFTRSTKANLEVVVGAAPIQARYLRLGIHGGARPAKSFERAFLGLVRDTRGIPSGAQLVPGPGVRLDAQGNVSRQTIKRIGAGLSAKARGGFFYGKPKGGDRPVGIYRRSRQQLFAYFLAIDQRANYRPQFPILQLGTDKAQQVFGDYLRTALSDALASAR